MPLYDFLRRNLRNLAAGNPNDDSWDPRSVPPNRMPVPWGEENVDPGFTPPRPMQDPRFLALMQDQDESEDGGFSYEDPEDYPAPVARGTGAG